MNLDVNFRRLRQENLQQDHGSNIIGSIFDQDGKTFQNSPIHLIFYKRVYDYKDDLLLTLKEKPKLSSMGWCQFNKKSVNTPPHLLNKELIFEYQGISAKWVTTEQYAQLLFILGLEETGSSGNLQSFKKILTFFNNFNTSTKENFQEMIKFLQFPYVYNEFKTLGENRHDFKFFFVFDQCQMCSYRRLSLL